MAPEHDSTKRASRKLIKKRRPQRHPSVQYPERLKKGEDVHEDVTAMKGKPSQNMNQSVFSMIAAAGSKVDFHARFEDDSSDSEVDEPSKAVHDPQKQANSYEISTANQKSGLKYRYLSSQGTLKDLPRLNLRTVKEKNYMSQSNRKDSAELLSPTPSSTSITPRDAPVMSMMLQAQAQLDSSVAGFDQPEVTSTLEHSTIQIGHSDLVIRLKEIFGFDKPEEVISGEPMGVKIVRIASDDSLP